MRIDGFTGFVGLLVVLAIVWGSYEAGKRNLLW